MTRAEFHNALRILNSIDQYEVPFLMPEQWVAFQDNPFRFFITCDDETCDALWAIIRGRMK